MELCVPWTKKISSKITKHILASLRFSNISEILSNQVEEEKKCLPEEIFSKKKMKTNFVYLFVCHLLSCGLSLPQNIFFRFNEH